MFTDLSLLEKMQQGLSALKNIEHNEYYAEPREMIFKNNDFKLYHYHAKSGKINLTPTLIIFSTLNRPAILELGENYSFLGDLLKKGLDVYLIDWGDVNNSKKTITLTDYFLFIERAIEQIKEKNTVSQINLLGICQGGILALCLASLIKDIKNLILISTPIDFHTTDHFIANGLSRFNTEALLKDKKNLPGHFFSQFFMALNPFDILGKKYLKLLDKLEDQVYLKKFISIEKWLHDVPHQSNDLIISLINSFYKKNKLIKGEFKVKNKTVDLKNITVPILNVMARLDDIVPISTSKPLKFCAKSRDYHERYYKGGHIGIYLSDKIRKKMVSAISTWLKKRDI